MSTGDTAETCARRLIEQRLARGVVRDLGSDHQTGHSNATPVGIEGQLRLCRGRHPALAWDDALAQIIGGQNGRDVVG